MGDVKNPSFETPGVGQGEASNWAGDQSAGAEDVAPFQNAAGETTSREEFDTGWYSNEDAQQHLTDSGSAAALFEDLTLPYEPFEYSWGPPGSPASPPAYNHMSQMSYADENFTGADFDSGTPEEFEDFEEEWQDNETAEADFDSATSSAASFDSGTPEGFEDFEEEWNDNETAEADFDSATSSPALFDAGANPHENFEGTWTTTLP